MPIVNNWYAILTMNDVNQFNCFTTESWPRSVSHQRNASVRVYTRMRHYNSIKLLCSEFLSVTF